VSWSSGKAVISPCGTYRYRLERSTELEGKTGLWIGINPSTADHITNDHSIRKLYGFGERLHINHWLVGNVFAYRSVDVRDLARAEDPVGPRNLEHLLNMAVEADVVIAGWGNTNKVPRRLLPHFGRVIDLVTKIAGKDLMCWGRTASGDPCHPLMLRYETPLEKWA